jgi:Mitochondrial ribosomal protein (VAR1)
LKRDFRILTEIGNLLYKEKNKPVLEKDLKNNKFPLSLFSPLLLQQGQKKKGSFLNQETYDYLNSVSPKILRGANTIPNVHKTLFNLNNNELSSCGQIQKEASIKTRNDVIYQYLKTFSLFNKRKNGILIQYNQHIGYNFNSKNILLRGVESHFCPLQSKGSNKSLPFAFAKAKETNKNMSKPLLEKEPKINKVNTIFRELNKLKGVSGLTGYNRTANNRLIKYSYKLLFYFFKSMYCLISKPVFLITPDKVTIQLFYFLNIPKSKVFKWYSILNNNLIRQKWYSLFSPQLQSKGRFKINDNLTFAFAKAKDSNKEIMNKVKLSWRIKKTLFRLNKKRSKVKNTLFNLNKFNLFKVFSLKFKLICEILSNKFKKPVELQLIRVHQPFHDSNILVNLLSLNIRNKKFKTNVAIEKLYAKKAVKNLYDYSIKSVNFIPSFLSGIKIRIGGRLMREPIIPRITTKNFERGASSPGKVNFLDTATITKKNRKGSYTIKISSGQNFF